MPSRLGSSCVLPWITLAVTGMLIAQRPTAAAASPGRPFTLNEVMLRNDSFGAPAFLDEDLSKQPFVELVNSGESAASLAGWTLGSTGERPRSWTFPQRTLAPGEHLVVWLSGKNRATSSGPLHTGFTLLPGASLELREPAGALVDSLEVLRVPADVSYGRCTPDGSESYYFAAPTPGAANDTDAQLDFVIDQAHVSLGAGATHRLTVLPAKSVTWESDNPLVSVDSSGAISAARDAIAPEGRATVRARLAAGNFAYATEVTIVDWLANVSRLEVHALPQFSQLLGNDDQAVYYSLGPALFASSDGLETALPVGVRPEPLDGTARLLVTPFGYVLRNATRIYHSTDLDDWSLSFETQEIGLYSTIDHDYDATAGAAFVYLGEYSANDPAKRHRVYRGTFDAAGGAIWQTLLDFPSFAEWSANPAVVDAVRHVHVVRVDPYTGHVFVGTGDSAEHSRIYYSTDGGESFRLLGMGDQTWRTLAIWFTPGFVYWSMDTTGRQSIWRIPRSAYDASGGFPSLTPELDSGTTRIGRHYYVTANASPGRFPVGVGRVFTSMTAIPLDAQNRARALDDPAYDYRERVAELANGAHWYQMFVKDESGQQIALLATSAEGAWRDERGRVFGIKELSDGQVIVQELMAVAPASDAKLSIYVQLEPLAQDPAGFVYLRGRETGHRFYQARLVWSDAASGPTGGEPAPPPPAEVCIPLPEPEEWLGWLTGLAGLAALARRRRLRPASERPARPA